VQCRDAAAAIVRASVVRERRRRVIYGGGRRARSNWLTTKEFKRINAKFDVLRGGATRCWSEIPAPFVVNQQRSYIFSASMGRFFSIMFLISKRRVGHRRFFFRPLSIAVHAFARHPSPDPPTPTPNRDASARYNIGIYIKKKDALDSAADLQ